MKHAQNKTAVALISLQVVLLLLFAIFTQYDKAALPWPPQNANGTSIEYHYPMFQDVHVMIFVGFGFLMMFLRKYGYSAVGFTLLLGAIMVQWAALCQGFLKLDHGKINLSLVSLLNADVATAAVLISMGAVLGKTTPLQLVLMGFVEMVFFAANEYLSSHVLQAVDLGGSMVVHVFGAYFGLAVSRALGRPAGTTQERSSYTSDMFSMVGTVFLWLFWPSFNGALAVGPARHRAVINTYLALASGCVAAFAVSSLSQRGGKFNMVHVQNATLAGGVAMGTAADLLVQPVGALVVGCLAGALSVVGYAYLQPWVLSRFKVHDTCGVHNLHGMPGVMAAIVGAVMAAFATDAQNDYGNALYVQFPAMAPTDKDALEKLMWEGTVLLNLQPGLGRSAGKQAAFQLASLCATLVVSLASGTLTGYVIRQSKLLRQAGKEDLFEDGPNWDVPDEESGEARPAATAMATLQVATTARMASAASTEAAANSIPSLEAEAPKEEANKW
ncbi:ammonium transporter Rh type A [Thrips palmi]|uniref:Ammonium transporter Rh type A n=1 Tax=Thrips palmi TaxID=161013 RepID=A0A6P8YW18_THRPL|nr:ammonium transporter Rh type A [Thrips palmi]